MQHSFLKISAVQVVLLAIAVLSLLTTGCSSVGHDRGAWLSDEDLQACKAAALDSFAAGYTMHHRDESQPVLIRVDDWRTPTLTVFLPVRETLPAGLTYAYYRFEGTERFGGQAELVAYAHRQKPTLKLVEHGLTSWGTGPLIR